MISQKCSITIPANTFLIVPLILRVNHTTLGENVIYLNPGIATLVGYGSIQSPKKISFRCKKTLLHINPFKTVHDIVITKNMNGYEMGLKNTIDKTIRVPTQITQLKK